MFCRLPDSFSIASHTLNKTKKHKKSKKHTRKLTKKQHDKNSKFSGVMSSWAESFTAAATWQLKHQLAYWKARTISLEYENSVLHDVIRQNHLVVPSSCRGPELQAGVALHNYTSEYNVNNIQTEVCDGNYEDAPNYENEAESDENDSEIELEPSEEFIQFLMKNAQYKEDARQERERLKEKMAAESLDNVPEPQESSEVKIKRKKELYGDNWQSITALEMSLMSDFINESDKHKPMYWPNIPLNLNSHCKE